MKFVVTGAGGMLGHDIVNELGKNGSAIPFDINDFDVSDEAASREKLTCLPFDFIVNCSALTDVDGCETMRDEALRVNSHGAGILSRIACEADVPVLYFSTDYIFDGKSGEPYRETDEPSPLNVYGWSKLEGEKKVAENNHRHYIIRTAWLYGKNGGNFVKTIARKYNLGEILRVVNDQKGPPTWTRCLARGVADLIKAHPPYGIYNMTSSGSCTWYEAAVSIVNLLGGNTDKIVPISSCELNRPAERPRNSILDNGKLAAAGVRPLKNWNEALFDFINEVGVE